MANKTAKRSTKLVTPAKADKLKARAEEAGRKGAALITKMMNLTPDQRKVFEAAIAEQKKGKGDEFIADFEDTAALVKARKRKAVQQSAERSNPLCGCMAGDTLSNCRQVLQFLRSTTFGISGTDALSPDEAMGLFMIYNTVIDALKRQEAAL